MSRRVNKTGDGDDDPTLIEEVVAIAREVDDPVLLSRVLNACGSAYAHDYESARPYFAEATALARELGTSHQLLKHYLDRLEKWLYQERFREAKKQSEGIRARAAAEGRYMTAWEEQQVRACDRASISAMVAPMLLDQIERIKQADKHGPLNCYQIKTVKLLARGFPEARELLQKYSQVV